MSSTAQAPLASAAGATALLFLHAETSLHPGSGASVGVVDLPIQRERHTLWPVIPGSALKGILRDASRRRTNGEDLAAADRDDTLQAVFGPSVTDREEARGNAGALSVTDARLLAFPVRSLRGVFAWATCPAILERLARDLALGGGRLPAPIPRPDRDQAYVPPGSPLLCDGAVVLEEFDFARAGDLPASIGGWFAGALPQDPAWAHTADRLRQSLVVLHDDDFTHFARYATEITARIGLDYERKTVRSGALFYQEFLPPETIFYSVLLATQSRRRGNSATASDVLRFVEVRLPRVLQVGGDETTGKGFCSIRLARV